MSGPMGTEPVSGSHAVGVSTATGTGASDGRSLGEIVGDLSTDLTTLVKQELTLADRAQGGGRQGRQGRRDARRCRRRRPAGADVGSSRACAYLLDNWIPGRAGVPDRHAPVGDRRRRPGGRAVARSSRTQIRSCRRRSRHSRRTQHGPEHRRTERRDRGDPAVDDVRRRRTAGQGQPERPSSSGASRRPAAACSASATR